MALNNRNNEILWNDWDPIGVSDTPEARDEYYRNIPEVFSLALKNGPAEKIAEYLHWGVSERMDFDQSKVSNHLPLVEKILAAQPGA